MEMRKETNEQPTTLSKYTGLGVTITAELMIGFWFGVRVILAWGSGWFELFYWSTYERYQQMRLPLE